MCIECVEEPGPIEYIEPSENEYTRELLEAGEIARAADRMPADWWNADPLALTAEQFEALRSRLALRGIGIEEIEPGIYLAGRL